VALTASRTAWLGLLLLGRAVWYWRYLWPWRPTPGVATGLAMGLFFFVWIIPFAAQAVFLGTGEAGIDGVVRVSSEMRPQVWALFLDAIWHKPWSGYGWNQTSMAQLAVALEHPPLGTVFSHAHNLILDLLLYCGVPLGLVVSGVLAIWLWRRFRAIKDATSALLFLFLVVVGNHAMLEFPLHYAYFLLPAGLVIGTLDARLNGRLVAFGQRWIAGVMWVASALLLSVTVRDYLRVEASYQALRFEWANFRTNNSRSPPEVLLLDQLRDMIIFARFEPSAGMSLEQLDWMRRVAGLYPNAGTVHKLATALVWNNRPDEAVLWFRRMCTMVPETQCLAIRNALKKQAESDPQIAAVFWP
ncbi:MAG: Wzy polymerase domain-containing protein, partial [Rhodoferax sp.]|nr:Wzy polymerase domain-containing protein [Rhodoferax sp.]